jgi:flagellar motor switch protein FliN/FliY
MASHSLPLAEIESLLRSAREKVHQPATGTHDEPLGPGDVQYLRGDSSTGSISIADQEQISRWPESIQSPDQLLQQTEQRLAEAILVSDQHHADAKPEATGSQRPRIQPSPRLAARPGVTLEDLADVDLDISIELGRAEILIEDVLKLREGSVVSLNKLAGDPVDIVANGRLVARGELLVIDGKFGVRLSEVL